MATRTGITPAYAGKSTKHIHWHEPDLWITPAYAGKRLYHCPMVEIA